MAELPGATPVIRYETIGSTNAEALAHSDGPAPCWFVANRQTSGRGRRGRVWQSEPGNLYATLLLVDIGPVACLPQLCFVASLALYDAVRAVTGIDPLRIGLKWPNDVLIDGRKLAGILLEGAVLPGGRRATVIGFGVNCAHHPLEAPYPTVDLAAAGYPTDPPGLLRALDAAMWDRIGQWDGGRGFAHTREAWLRRAPGLGQPVTVRLPGREMQGVFEALDVSGAMVLRCRDGGREIISAGDVFPSSGAQG
ncbi:BirA family biotin operon repressor/biotin-[acetyl-CoA-carboxylase] ligase [Angulomicrobium tetraedrale]|uniref:biotin--[biotin carboxyl-carrier protein] ligase n=1 Tax=Ancylobacter tetraedralis TaxID=217068 RepID=A0A839Z4A5_9HYPH|nr:biotin--[acetyl-CoA-carboxylase] ligase [Ancylobacter tetraedralis]MBB3770452.1 BirA family biotin operon repressor/biotin-[acetyl-CoA-carboxylase] ligase [Ancylobacter tetraedralis]